MKTCFRFLALVLWMSPVTLAAKKMKTPLDAVEAFRREPTMKQVLFTTSFEKQLLGQPPQGFRVSSVGPAPEARWEIGEDRQAPTPPEVLVQKGETEPGLHLTLALLESPAVADLDFTVMIKTMQGETEQMAGLVWRFQDPENFYWLRASSNDDTCTLYRVRKGKSKAIDTKTVIISPYLWHKLRVIVVENTYRVYFDGQLLMGGKDKAILTPGPIGLATAGDAQSAFDNLVLAEPIPFVTEKKKD